MNKFIALFLALVGFSNAAKPEPTINQSSAVTAETNFNSEYTAWVNLGSTIDGKNMTFFDGGQSDSSSSTYNEKVFIDGVSARKFYLGNHAYFKMDETTYDKKNDHAFFIDLTFYQFGPERGRITFNYASLTGKKTITLWKEKDPMWASTRVYIDDACFDHSIVDDKDPDVHADIQLVSGVYNAFSQIVVTNANTIEYNNEFNVGLTAKDSAKSLYELGLYSSSQDDATSDLASSLTKARAAAKIVKIIGREKEALKYSSNMTDTTDEENHAIGYLQKNNYISWTGSGKAPITQTEIVDVFLKIQGIKAQEDIIDTAIEKGVVKTADMIMQPNKTATEDNLVALGYNWIFLKNKHGAYNIAEMMDNKLISEETIKNNSSTRISCLYYVKPRKLERQEIIDDTTGRKYYHVDRGTQLVRDYYTANFWTSDNKRFVVEDYDAGDELFLYDTEKNTLQFLCYGNDPVVSKKTDRMYYFTYYDDPGVRKVRRMDLNTFESEDIAPIYDGLIPGWGSSLTDDEKFLSINGTESRSDLDIGKNFAGEYLGMIRQRKAPILNIETGEWNATFHKEFVSDEKDGTVLNHVILNPVYDNLVFFAHEGTQIYTPDRIWLLDTNTNEAFNLFRQKQRTEEITGEPAGHEMWFGNGERLGFVKYPKSTNLCYSGIMTIDLTGKHKEYVNDDYQYWHCCASPANDRFIVADTNNSVNGRIEIVLIDRYTGEATLLCRPLLGNWSHPGNPHPAFSLDGRQVSFVCNNGNGVIATAWMDISDIVDKPADGSRMQISDELEVPSYKGTENYIEKSNKNGEDCYKIPVGKKMLVNVLDEKHQGDRVDATITFSYYDEGYAPIKFSYFGWNEKSEFIDKTEAMTYLVNRKNSKKWKTQTLDLKDINLDNMEFIGTDFRLEGVYSEAYIKDIKVEVNNIISTFMDQCPLTKYYKVNDETEEDN